MTFTPYVSDFAMTSQLIKPHMLLPSGCLNKTLLLSTSDQLCWQKLVKSRSGGCLERSGDRNLMVAMTVRTTITLSQCQMLPCCCQMPLHECTQDSYSDVCFKASELPLAAGPAIPITQVFMTSGVSCTRACRPRKYTQQITSCRIVTMQQEPLKLLQQVLG